MNGNDTLRARVDFLESHVRFQGALIEAKDRRADRATERAAVLAVAHRANADEIYTTRQAVTPDTAWEAFQRSNATVIRMAERSRQALAECHEPPRLTDTAVDPDQVKPGPVILVDDPHAELDAVAAAIGTTRFMDPPDGGEPTLAEQVRRMSEALADAERGIEGWIKIGAPCRVVENYRYGEWCRVPLWIAGINAKPKETGDLEIDITVSDCWPPRHLGNLTSGFEPKDLDAAPTPKALIKSD